MASGRGSFYAISNSSHLVLFWHWIHWLLIQQWFNLNSGLWNPMSLNILLNTGSIHPAYTLKFSSWHPVWWIRWCSGLRNTPTSCKVATPNGRGALRFLWCAKWCVKVDILHWIMHIRTNSAVRGFTFSVAKKKRASLKVGQKCTPKARSCWICWI